MIHLEEADRSAETAYNRLIARIRAETDKRPMCLPGTPELIDELIAQFERVENQNKQLRRALRNAPSNFVSGKDMQEYWDWFHGERQMLLLDNLPTFTLKGE